MLLEFITMLLYLRKNIAVNLRSLKRSMRVSEAQNYQICIFENIEFTEFSFVTRILRFQQ